ncbi:MAG: hypothetical protein KY475_27100 [Planctomycetes bacterium]|nr:hypothetical protein [Planctomycetota bacterium]
MCLDLHDGAVHKLHQRPGIKGIDAWLSGGGSIIGSFTSGTISDFIWQIA